jgi:uncharacterized protein YxjI
MSLIKLSTLRLKFSFNSIHNRYESGKVDVLNLLYIFARQERKVATVSKKFVSKSKTAKVEIIDDQDQAFFLTLRIVIHILFLYKILLTMSQCEHHHNHESTNSHSSYTISL